MKKIKFEELKLKILNEELDIFNNMFDSKDITAKELKEFTKELTEEFDLINKVEVLVDWYAGRGLKDYEAYELIINHLVEEPKPKQEEFHAKDWNELNQNLKEKFGTGSFRFFNNKRVNHRMIKICADHETIQIYKYLYAHYPEFEPEYFNFKKEKWPNRRAISIFVTIKCPL